MPVTSQIIGLLNNIFNPIAPVFQTFNRNTGASIQDYIYDDPPLAFPNNIYPVIQRSSDKAILCCGNSSDNFQGLIIFNSALEFVSSQSLPAPFTTTSSGTNCPWLYTSSDGTMYGLWFGTTDSQLITLDPDTFAQTVLWNNFNTASTFCNGGDISSDGSTFFYIEIPDASVGMHALNTTTGVTSTFATLSGYHFVAQTKPISCGGSNQVFIPWVKDSTNDIRVIVYEINSSVTLDLDLTGVMTDFAFIAPESDGSAFWIAGFTGSGSDWKLNRYLLPSGSLDTTTTVTIDSDSLFFQLTILDIGPRISATAILRIAGPLIMITGSILISKSGLYYIKPNKRNDTLWVGNNTTMVKIPDPFAISLLVGN